jgi:hypothetical protein
MRFSVDTKFYPLVVTYLVVLPDDSINVLSAAGGIFGRSWMTCLTPLDPAQASYLLEGPT